MKKNNEKNYIFKNKRILIFNTTKPKDYFKKLKHYTNEALIFLNDPAKVAIKINNYGINSIILYTNEEKNEHLSLETLILLSNANVPVLVLINSLLNKKFIEKLNVLKVPYLVQDDMDIDSLLRHLKNNIVGFDLTQHKH